MSDDTSVTGIIIYEGADGVPKISVHMEGETVWLTQAQLAELFATTKQNISLHILNIFEEGELSAESVVKEYLTTAADGKSYRIKHYNLDVIVAIGYRAKSDVGTRFRQWATTRLSEYMIKGFTMDDERLKGAGGGQYWKELLDRIRDIRSSEKALYRQVLDLYATSMDYDPHSKESVQFFKVVQNKLHYAASKHTTAELIHERADATHDFMGLTTFAGAMPSKAEVVIAKNYLTKDELLDLNNLVSAFFDLAEMQARKQNPMRMKDWVAELDTFSGVYGKGVLEGAGAVSHEAATEKAEAEYRKYQAKTLSPVEKAYLESIKNVQKDVEGVIRSNKK